jgi:Fe-S cluster biogenesis protein NfuA
MRPVVTAPIITHEPIDVLTHKFMADRRLAIEDGPQKFTDVEQAQDTPAAEAVLSVEGVHEVIIDGSEVLVVRDTSGPAWQSLVPQIEYALMTAYAAVSSTPSLPAQKRPETGTGAADGDDVMYELVERIFEDEINPIVAQHGGAIDLIDVQDATVVVRMSGGCQGCGMANVTLRQGIEASLRRAIPNLAGVRDVTDHGSGSNPYFASTGK